MFFQIFCCQWHSYAHFGSLFNLNIPDPCGVKVSSHFWANEPYIYGWWGLKMGLFYGKNSPKWRVGSRAEKPPWKLANGPKHTPSNRERCFGHFYPPSRYHSRSRWVRKWVIYGSNIAKMTGCHIEQKNQPGNWIMDQTTPQAIGKDVLGTFMPHPGVIPGPGGSENGWFRAQK